MSYDLRIRSDDQYSHSTSFDELYSFIASLPHMSLNGDTGFIYGDSQKYHMEIDLEFANAEGDCEPPRDNIINCVNCHIPYVFLVTEDDSDPAIYFNVCRTIASHLKGRVYDLQLDKYI
jgi:hypothetical protein